MAGRKSKEAGNPRLRRYHAKRDLAVSGEPGGDTDRPLNPAAIRRFVIQKHDATRLHYDFRLEMDGVLRSWAVPKGLPTKAGERALAIEVEDHPLEYGTFEGTIPEGNYGAGAVMLWDRGRYTVSGGAPEKAYRSGKLHLALLGEKCVGEWTLVRLHDSGDSRKTNWLMIKNSAPAHRAPLTGPAREKSVLTGRTMAEIAGGGESRPRPRPRATARRSQARPFKKKRRTPRSSRR